MASTSEIAASLTTAEEHLKDARDAFRRGRYQDCVYHSASTAENAANALILSLGGRIPRTHRNAEAIRFIATRLKPGWLEEEDFKRMLVTLKDLEAHVVKSRYPVKVEKGTFIPPNRYYTDKMAKDMLKGATFIFNVVKHFLTLL